MSDLSQITGIIHGRNIELDRDAGLPDGAAVSVVVTPARKSEAEKLEALREAFGSCAEEAEDLDRFLEWSREQRKASRPRIGE